MSKKIIICSGGTGGHILPAIRFGNFLIKQGFECTLILDERGKKYSNKFIGNINIIKSSHFSGNFFLKIRGIINLFIGFVQALIIIFQIRPTKVMSFGSYATFAPMVASLFLKIFFKSDLYLHEQNSVMGKVNLFFINFSKKIFTTFESVNNLDIKYNSKKYSVGFNYKKISKESHAEYKKTKTEKIIFLYGGSQGSVPLIKKFLLILNNFDKKILKEIKVIIQSPKGLFASLNQTMNTLNISFVVNEFFDNIDEILNITDIAITRAGSGTINDIVKYKIPSIVIPLPHSIHNHQYYNAKYLFDKGAAILIKEENFNEYIGSKTIKNLLEDPIEKDKIIQSLNKIYLLNSNEIMLSEIFS